MANTPTNTHARTAALAIVQKYDLLHPQIPDNTRIARLELARIEGIPYQVAANHITRCLDRLRRGLDPIRDNRGGFRKGAGRKRGE